VDDADRIVFTFSPGAHGTWYFSRVSSFHLDNGKDKFVMRQEPDGSDSWVLENQTGGKAEVFGTPKEPGACKDASTPPLGKWKVWGCQFTLTNEMPTYKPVKSPCHFEVPFASLHYHEKDRVAYMEFTMKAVPISDDDLEAILAEMRRLLKNLARRPDMVLMMRSDGRQTPERPALAHIRRFLNFVQQDVGTECVLAGRGSAIVLVPSGLLGRALLGIVEFVQRILPAPYPQAIVSTTEEADAFLEELAVQSRAWLETLPKPKDSNGTTSEKEDKSVGYSPLSAHLPGLDEKLATPEPSTKVPTPAESKPSYPPQPPAAVALSREASKEVEYRPMLDEEMQTARADILEGLSKKRPSESRGWLGWCTC